MKKLSSFVAMVFVTAIAIAQPCTKLFISEYVETIGNGGFTKAIEIYNPSLVPVNLSGYKLQFYVNGSTNPTGNILNLKGVIASKDVYVIATRKDSMGVAKSQVDTSWGGLTFNGDDAIQLLNGTDTLDVIGVIGQDPGTAWPVTATDSTKDRSLVRKITVNTGSKNWATGSGEWDVFPANDFSHLGSHTANACAAPADTLVGFSTNADVVAETAGTYNVTINLNQSVTSTQSVSVALTAFGNGGSTADVNNYTTQVVNFSAGSNSATLLITITNDALKEGTETFTFKISAPSAGLKLTADTTFTLSITDDDSIFVTPGLPFYPIATIHTEDPTNFDADSANVRCRIGGVVYGVNLRKTGLGFYINDHTGGIYIFSPTKTYNYVPTEGDSVIVQGKVSQNQGVINTGFTEFTFLDTVYKVSSGNGLLAPIVLSGRPTEDEESYLVRVNGLTYTSGWTNSGPGFTVKASIGATSYTIRIDSLTTAYGTAQPSKFDVIGLVSQYDTSAPHDFFYTINPRYAADIIRTSGINEVANNLDALVYPNPNNGSVYVTVSLEKATSLTSKLFDISGREITNNVFNAQEGDNRFKLDLMNVPNGLYILELKADDKSTRTKINVLK